MFILRRLQVSMMILHGFLEFWKPTWKQNNYCPHPPRNLFFSILRAHIPPKTAAPAGLLVTGCQKTHRLIVEKDVLQPWGSRKESVTTCHNSWNRPIFFRKRLSACDWTGQTNLNQDVLTNFCGCHPATGLHLAVKWNIYRFSQNFCGLKIIKSEPLNHRGLKCHEVSWLNSCLFQTIEHGNKLVDLHLVASRRFVRHGHGQDGVETRWMAMFWLPFRCLMFSFWDFSSYLL